MLDQLNKELEDKGVSEYRNKILSKIPDTIKDDVVFVKYKEHGKSVETNDTNLLPTVYDLTNLNYMFRDNTTYRIIPRYPDYCINAKGDVVNINNNKYVTSNISNSGYITINIFDPVYSKIVTRLLHRLVAMAWCENTDYSKNNLVDHIDSNKLNNNASNLRWVSNGFNTARASNSLDYPWIVKCLDTGEIKTFYSLSQVAEFLGIDKRNMAKNKCPMMLKSKTKGRWILDSVTDFSNFGFSKEISDGVGVTGNMNKVYYSLHVDGELVAVYDTIMDLLNAHNYRRRMSYYDTKSWISKYYKKLGKKALLKGHNLKDLKVTYYAKNTSTGAEYTANSISELSRIINVPKATVTSRFSNKIGLAIGDWIFKTSNDDDYPEHTIPDNVSEEIILRKDGSTAIFKSLREVSKFLGVDRNTITKYIETNQVLNGYNITKK